MDKTTDMKTEILNELRSRDDYVSGQELSVKLGVTRTAVWKAIGALRREGYPIEASTNRGYRLTGKELAGADLLNQAELEACFDKTKWAGHPVIYRAETGSTNSDIMKLSDEGAQAGTLVVSSRQTAGRGRRGRTWISPASGNVYMSILLKPQIPAETAPQLTLVMALSIAEAANALMAENGCTAVNGARFGIKWPNDVVAANVAVPSWKKCVGILTEMRLEEQEIRDVTIGTGLNIDMEEIPAEIADTATTFRLAAGQAVNRSALIVRIWQYFEECYGEFMQAGGFAPLRGRYEALLVNEGRKVRVLDPKEPFSGTAEGITDSGELIVRTEDGGTKQVFAGEVSVRGVEGYV